MLHNSLAFLILFTSLLSFNAYSDDSSGNSSENLIKKHLYLSKNLNLNSTKNKFNIYPHKPNYIMPITFSRKINDNGREDLLETEDGKEKFDNTEAKFQISFKAPILSTTWDDQTSFWFAYTQISFWQVYNSNISKPFRENNYEPEFFLKYQPIKEYRLFGARNVMNLFSINHQSNGRDDKFSRSWNRVVASYIFEKDSTIFIIKPWIRIPEDEEEDDNPDIEKYVGNGELQVIHKLGDSVCGIKYASNFRPHDWIGSIELSWSVPISLHSKLYFQFFEGFGENLIDYDRRSTRLGAGILLADWL